MIRSDDGDYVAIGADAGSVTKELAEIDPGLKVRLNHKQGFFAVFHESIEGDQITHQLVATRQAHRNSFGCWEGLGTDVVEEVRRIRPGGGVDVQAEREAMNAAAEQKSKDRIREAVEPLGELAAFAARKDLDVKRSAFISKKVV